ncbi:MAG: hypothetical protein HS099_03425 [Ardenticatenaceae bacterium]|nr:hypothetical protein [Ardenticatenaceae bacterium]
MSIRSSKKIAGLLCLIGVLPVLIITSCRSQAGPSGIPLLAGASVEVTEERKLVYTVDQPINEVSAFYEAKMPEMGWIYVSTRTVLENGRTIIINKYHQGKGEVEIAFFEQEGKTFVSILVTLLP